MKLKNLYKEEDKLKNKIKIPKGQKSWTRYVENGEIKYIVTSTIARDKYFLNEINEDGSLNRVATSKHPVFKGFNL